MDTASAKARWRREGLKGWIAAGVLVLSGAAGAQEPEQGAEEQEGTSEAQESISLDDLLGESAAAPAEEPTTFFMGGYLFEELRVDTRDQSEQTGESPFETWTRAYLFMEPKLGSATKFRVSAALNFFTQQRDGTTQGLYTVGLDEAYLFHAFSSLQLKIGQQVISWGVMDSQSPQDQLSPRDVRFTILKPQDEGLERVPVLAARAFFPVTSQHTLEAVFVPIAPMMRGATVGTDFALLRPGLLSGLASDYAGLAAGAPAELQPLFLGLSNLLAGLGQLSPRDQLQDTAANPLAPGPAYALSNVEGGARMTGTTGIFDYGLSVLTAHERLPRLHLSEAARALLLGGTLPETAEPQAGALELASMLRAEYPRFTLYGLDVAARLGPVILKAEAAYRNRSTFYRLDLQPVSAEQLDAGLHLEYLRGTTFTFVLEALGTHILRDTRDLAFVEQDSVRLLGRLSYSVLRERLRFRLEGGYELAYEDFFIAPDVTYELSDQLTVSVGAQYFGGPAVTLGLETLTQPAAFARVKLGAFSYYRDQSFFLARLKYGF